MRFCLCANFSEPVQIDNFIMKCDDTVYFSLIVLLPSVDRFCFQYAVLCCAQVSQSKQHNFFCLPWPMALIHFHSFSSYRPSLHLPQTIQPALLQHHLIWLQHIHFQLTLLLHLGYCCLFLLLEKINWVRVCYLAAQMLFLLFPSVINLILLGHFYFVFFSQKCK